MSRTPQTDDIGLRMPSKALSVSSWEALFLMVYAGIVQLNLKTNCRAHRKLAPLAWSCYEDALRASPGSVGI